MIDNFNQSTHRVAYFKNNQQSTLHRRSIREEIFAFFLRDLVSVVG